METTTLAGITLEESYYIPGKEKPILIFRDANTRQTIAVDETALFQNILLMGAAGCGKTNIINQVLYQLRAWNDEPYTALVFDTKADYVRHRGFCRPMDDVLGSSRQFRDRSAVWNIFEEILADGENPLDYEANAREIAAVLFEGRGSATQPFFALAAQEIFASTLIYFIRRRKEAPDKWQGNLNNRYLVLFLKRHTPQQLRQLFSIYADMEGLSSYFGDGTSNQSLGVFGELRSMLDQCFQGIFAMEAENGRGFSIRKAVRNKQNRAIFIEYDMSAGERLTPMYRLLVDLALKEALRNDARGRTHLILDELKLLPRLSHLQDALNFGRGMRLSVVAGIQNVNQLYATYGEAGAGELLEGFGTLIAMKSNDHDSREYISKRFGPNKVASRYYTPSYEPVDTQWDGHTVEHWHLQRLQRGQAVVGLASQSYPFVFQFEKDAFM